MWLHEFIGHTMLGSLFFVIGIYWTIQIFRRYIQAFMKNGPPFRGSPSYSPQTGCLQHFDITGIAFVMVGAIGMFIEIVITVTLPQPVPVKHLQYITIYFFFVLFGILSLLNLVFRKKLPEIETMCYLTIAMAFFVECIVFKFDLFGKNELDVILHTLLYNVIFLSTLITLLEIKYKNSVIVTLSRAYLSLLQGTWFCQIGFILYNPIQGSTPWDRENRKNLMLIVCMFTWHMGAVLLVMMMTGLFIALIYGRPRSYPYITGLSIPAKSEDGYVSLSDPSNDSDSYEF